MRKLGQSWVHRRSYRSYAKRKHRERERELTPAAILGMPLSMESLPLCQRSANAPLFIRAVVSSPFYILTLMLLLQEPQPKTLQDHDLEILAMLHIRY
jgi:hypothetical protein